MSRHCLDTSAYSHFRRGDPDVVELLDAAAWVGVPAVVLGELRTGFALGRRRAENEAELREFLENPVVEILPVDDDVAEHYAGIMVDLRRAGSPLPTNDVWIAATAVALGATVISYDRHFDQITRVGSVIL